MTEIICDELQPKLLNQLSSVETIGPGNLLPRSCLLTFHVGKLSLVKEKKKKKVERTKKGGRCITENPIK